MTPKSLLRNKLCVSRLDEMAKGTSFQRVIGETSKKMAADDQIKRVVLCTGKIYYDLLAEREMRNINNVALVRVEELYPFPQTRLGEQLKRYPKAEVMWAQEEPQNMGAWTYIDRKIEATLRGIGHKAEWPNYAGRVEAAAPATGYLKRHNKEQAEIVDKALTVK
jgi:2-oxoglutarate dehydrogenase E1 component